MPFKPMEIAKCPKCGKSVYAAEERLAGGYKWHKFCFKCETCNKMLDSTNSATHEDKLYCKGCHGKKYGPKGYGFGGGAGALSMDTGGQQCEMTNRPNEQHVGASTAGAVEGGCGRCGKRVYDAEKAIGLSVAWHKTCFNCATCHKSLDSTNTNKHENEIYCKNCYGKQFGPSGYGFGQGAGTLSMA